jgi:hypothetical protein
VALAGSPAGSLARAVALAVRGLVGLGLTGSAALSLAVAVVLLALLVALPLTVPLALVLLAASATALAVPLARTCGGDAGGRDQDCGGEDDDALAESTCGHGVLRSVVGVATDHTAARRRRRWGAVPDGTVVQPDASPIR